MISSITFILPRRIYSCSCVLGSIPGAVIGAFIIGICENIIKGLGWTTFSDAFTFALLIVILIAKPTGLFGEKVIDKV